MSVKEQTQYKEQFSYQTPVPDGENNVEAMHLSHCSPELFSESTWENEEQHDKQVRR